MQTHKELNLANTTDFSEKSGFSNKCFGPVMLNFSTFKQFFNITPTFLTIDTSLDNKTSSSFLRKFKGRENILQSKSKLLSCKIQISLIKCRGLFSRTNKLELQLTSNLQRE